MRNYLILNFEFWILDWSSINNPKSSIKNPLFEVLDLPHAHPMDDRKRFFLSRDNYLLEVPIF